MGQKAHPIGLRLGIVQEHLAKWYATKNYAETLEADIKARQFLEKKLQSAAVARIEIERPAPRSAQITIYTARPGVVIGKKGEGIEQIRVELSKLLNVSAHVSIEEVRKPEIAAKLIAESVAQQLERRIMFRRAMKRAVTNALRAGAKGIKICLSGRLGGAEIARSEWYREGRVPLHTFRANIDYGLATAKTTYGIIGVKVWIFKGDISLDSAKPSEVEMME